MHPSTENILKFFRYDHLPQDVQWISREFSELAHELANTLEGPEITVALRKLLEAKDCAVRSWFDS